MNRDDVIRMAREAGMHRQQHNLMSNPVQHRYSYDGYEENLERFAALVAVHIRKTEFKPDWINYQRGVEDGAAEEREACAKVCEEMLSMERYERNIALLGAAVSIRARGEIK